MASTATDGWIVVRHGKVVAEQYYGGMRPDTSHLLMSVSKSLVGMVVGALVGAGSLDVDAQLTRYVPALAQSGYAGATVRHILDMRSGIKFSEDYLDPTGRGAADRTGHRLGAREPRPTSRPPCTTSC